MILAEVPAAESIIGVPPVFSYLRLPAANLGERPRQEGGAPFPPVLNLGVLAPLREILRSADDAAEYEAWR